MKKNILSLKFFFNPRGVINNNQFDFGFIVLMTVFQGLLFFFTEPRIYNSECDYIIADRKAMGCFTSSNNS
jgi:hypothetical protein